ncbi:tRNA lysidine(34) synthetase TilS [Roseivirga sp.]|uniref:tRNA lysidine(34) synthetase TilS n=1 Tax=Roseivirga sp. TaxID=1964215 RepID=UPI002B27B707|nr:tRNA lysidine(34) synthetase TilS [Roseivirga sp.]
MLNRFLSFIKKHALNLEGNNWLLAVSGGMDSMALLKLCHQAGFNISVAHCNFNLRGEESDADAQFVKDTCFKLQIPYFEKHFDTKGYASVHGISTQMAARDLRYGWFNELLDEQNLDQLAVAHHAQDNLETVLLNLARGTSISGLRGMLPKSGSIIRPLLDFEREEIENFAKQEGIEWREDSSNASDNYKRNYLRHQVIPLFTQLNKGFYATFKSTLEKNLEVEKVFQEKINVLKPYIEEVANGYRFSKDQIIHSGIGAFQLSALLKPFGLNYEQSKELLVALAGISGKTFNTSSHQFLVDREYVFITAHQANEFEPFLIEEGEERFILSEQTFEIERLDADSEMDRNPTNAFLDCDKLTFPLEVRAWKEGDYFFPLGMKGKKKLSDFMIDQKIPLNLKDQIRVLTSKESIVWVIGYRIDDRFKTSDQTKEVLRISRN